MQYYSNPITEKEKISNALLSFDEGEFETLMQTIHSEWYSKGWDDRQKQIDIIRAIPDPINF